jgi:probable HAF family extracellular repeat protein
MRSKIVTCISALILTLLFAAAARMSAQQQAEADEPTHYRVVNLGNLSGSSSSGNTINDIGWAMGSANLAGNTTEHATVWIYGLRFDLGTLGGPNSDVAWPIKNDHGLVAGWSETAEEDPLHESWSCTAFTPTGVPTGHVCRGFVWQWGVMTALPTLGGNNGFAAGANNLGQIAGWAEDTVHDPTCSGTQVLQFEPVVYGPAKDEIRQLPTYHGDPDGAATAINDKGEVVGISGTCDVAVGAYSAKHALLWRNGEVLNLGSLGGAGWNTPMAINKRGDIVGFSDLPGDVSNGQLNANFHAFLWTKERGRMMDIGVLPGDSLSEALDINERGQVVGVSFPSTHAFIYENGKMTDLNKLIPRDSPLLLLAANGINDRGEITGQACVIADGGCPAGADTPAFLVVPTKDCDSNDEAVSATVSESVRSKVMRRAMFGHF